MSLQGGFQKIKSQKFHSGFTLTELLITVAIGGLLIAASATVIISEIRSGIATERFARAQQDFLRISSFINSEVGEGARLQYSQATTGCLPSGTSLVTIVIPYGFNSSTLLPNESIVHYYVSGGSLYRCGPPILATGALNPGEAISASQLNTNTQMTIEPASNSKGLAYALNFRNENNSLIFSQSSGSRARAGIVDN